MKSNHFRAQNGLFVQNDISFGKTFQLIFKKNSPFIMQNLKKKSLEWIQSYDVPFSAQNGRPFVPNEDFFQENH